MGWPTSPPNDSVPSLGVFRRRKLQLQQLWFRPRELIFPPRATKRTAKLAASCVATICNLISNFTTAVPWLTSEQKVFIATSRADAGLKVVLGDQKMIQTYPNITQLLPQCPGSMLSQQIHLDVSCCPIVSANCQRYSNSTCGQDTCSEFKKLWRSLRRTLLGGRKLIQSWLL